MRGGVSPVRDRTRTLDTPEVVTYRDQMTGVLGYLAIDGRHNPLAAGGFRVQPGLQPCTIARLAEAMTLKQRLLGLAVDGAKCGLDLDPQHPDKPTVMRRFLRFLRPQLLERFSMGPDMGTSWDEIESLAVAEGIPSVKIAVAPAQGLSRQEVLHRLQLLATTVGGRTLGQRRAGHGLAHAAIEAAGRKAAGLRVGIQGFGTVGSAAAQSLAEAGARIVVVADEHGALVADDGLDISGLLGIAPNSVTTAAPCRAAHRDEIFDVPVDALVLAAGEDAINADQAAALPSSVRVVVVGANLGLTSAVEDSLARRGVTVVPDFVGGCGGSASMNALFGPPRCPTPNEFLDRLRATMRGLVSRVLGRAIGCRLTPRAAALALCAEQPPCSWRTPYAP